jgi:P27 family predicted phage terminase small subunit
VDHAIAEYAKNGGFPLKNLAEFKPIVVPPKAPRHLKKPGRVLWKKLREEFDIEDAAGLELVRKIAEYEDQIIDMTAQIEKDGLTFKDRFDQMKAHPLLAARRDLQSAQLHTLKALNLDLEPLHDGPGRPSGR